MSILAFLFQFAVDFHFFPSWLGFSGDWKAVIGILFEFLFPPLASFLLCVPSTPVPINHLGFPFQSLAGKAVRLKPEIMTFHCHTGEMNETTKYHPINNGLLTAREEVSSARFIRNSNSFWKCLQPRKNWGKCCHFQEYVNIFKKYYL